MIRLLWILALAILFSNLAYSQESNIKEESKNYFVGGNIGFTSQKNPNFSSPIISVPGITPFIVFGNTSKRTNYNFSIYIGKNLTKNWSGAINMSYSSSLSITDNFSSVNGMPLEIENQVRGIDFGVFTRYTFATDNKLQFYLQPFLRYSLGNQDLLQDGLELSAQESNSINLGFSVGALYDINDKWRIILTSSAMTYRTGTWNVSGSDLDNNFSTFDTFINLSSLRFGGEYIF